MTSINSSDQLLCYCSQFFRHVNSQQSRFSNAGVVKEQLSMEFPQRGGGAFLKEMLEKLICIAHIFMEWFLWFVRFIIHFIIYHINDPIHSKPRSSICYSLYQCVKVHRAHQRMLVSLVAKIAEPLKVLHLACAALATESWMTLRHRLSELTTWLKSHLVL